ncbi:gonadotropin-releasing hormone receptor [Penaeus vannamei]|uniref:Gonadotropin-releasing hormone receptor n=1 Tax=Penaeus vannamei TaxID=6689 RepID=A0A3R7MWU1_PENVA|nr:gonadotropin-releasing hormone receptor [Penaeus vannamei]
MYQRFTPPPPLRLPVAVVFHVSKGPFLEEFLQCVTYGFYTALWQEQLYTTFSLVCMFILPLFILTDDLGNTCPEFNRRRLLRKAKMRALRISVVIVLAFIICWTPYYTTMVIFMFMDPTEHLSQELQSGIFFFGMSNSLINPIIYGAFHLCRCKNRRASFNLIIINRSLASTMHKQIGIIFFYPFPSLPLCLHSLPSLYSLSSPLFLYFLIFTHSFFVIAPSPSSYSSSLSFIILSPFSFLSFPPLSHPLLLHSSLSFVPASSHSLLLPTSMFHLPLLPFSSSSPFFLPSSSPSLPRPSILPTPSPSLPSFLPHSPFLPFPSPSPPSPTPPPPPSPSPATLINPSSSPSSFPRPTHPPHHPPSPPPSSTKNPRGEVRSQPQSQVNNLTRSKPQQHKSHSRNVNP